MSMPDVETTSKQRWYDDVSMLSQSGLNISQSYVESNWASDDYGFLNKWIVFIQLNKEIFLLYINNSTTKEIFKNSRTEWHIL